MSIYDKASLVLIPSGTKTSKVYSQKPVNGDGDFTFSRSTAATRVNADGNIEKQTGNYILYSQQIDNSYWNKYSMSVTANQAAAPDGTTTADLIDDGTNTGTHAIEENETIGYGGAVTISIHAKYVNTQYLVLAVYDTSYKVVVFDIQNGTIGNKSLSSLIATIEDLGNGWYRCAVTHPTNTRNNPFYAFGLRDDNVAALYTLAGSNRQAYVWGAQMEDGLVARDYIETTTAAVEGGITDNVPRLDYTDSSCPALLLEPQRQNIVNSSEYFEQSGVYNFIQCILTANDATSPEGYNNAYSMVANTTNGTHYFYHRTNPSLVLGQDYSMSIFVKANGYNRCHLTFNDNDGTFGRDRAIFNLTDGSIVSQDSDLFNVDIVPYGNGWYRVMASCEALANADGTLLFGIVDDNNNTIFSGNGTDGLYIYGYQVERLNATTGASYTTSYIPTYGTSVTRNGDKTFAENLGLTDSYTMFIEYNSIEEAETNFQDYISLQTNDVVTNGLRAEGVGADWRIYPAGLTHTMTFPLIGKISRLKKVLVVTPTSIKLFEDGALRASTTGTIDSHTIDVVATTRSGTQPASVQIASSWKQLLIFPTALSNEEAIALTTI